MAEQESSAHSYAAYAQGKAIFPGKLIFFSQE